MYRLTSARRSSHIYTRKLWATIIGSINSFRFSETLLHTFAHDTPSQEFLFFFCFFSSHSRLKFPEWKKLEISLCLSELLQKSPGDFLLDVTLLKLGEAFYLSGRELEEPALELPLMEVAFHCE